MKSSSSSSSSSVTSFPAPFLPAAPPAFFLKRCPAPAGIRPSPSPFPASASSPHPPALPNSFGMEKCSGTTSPVDSVISTTLSRAAASLADVRFKWARTFASRAAATFSSALAFFSAASPSPSPPPLANDVSEALALSSGEAKANTVALIFSNSATACITARLAFTSAFSAACACLRAV